MGINFDVPTNVGGGAYASTINAILNHLDGLLVSIKAPAFGAVGDGLTDDTVAIQDAIDAVNAAGGGIVFVPEGTFLYTFIEIFSNVHLVGAGRASVLKFQSGTNTNDALRGQGVSHASIRHLTVDYNHANNVSSQTGMRIAEESSYVTLDDCTFLNARGFAVSLAGLPTARNTHCRVSNCQVLDPISSPNDMFLVVSDHGLVYGNRVVGTDLNIAMVLYESDHMTAWGNEIELGSGSGHTGIGLLSCRYGNFYGNKVTGAGNGVGIGLYTEHDNLDEIPSERNSVWGNSVHNVGTGFQILETNYDRVVLNRVENTTNAVEFPVSAQPQAGNLLLAQNDLRYNNATTIANPGGASVNLWMQDNATSGSTVPSVASATTMDLPFGEEVVSVTGTTSITTITAVGHAGRRVTLVFAGALTMTDDSGNLRLAGNFTTTANDTITLACDGSNWYEVARSVI